MVAITLQMKVKKTEMFQRTACYEMSIAVINLWNGID